MSQETILARLELVAQQYPNATHRQLRNVIRETIVYITKMQPELTRPKVEYAGAGRKILDYLEENGPKQFAEIRDALPEIPARTIQAAIRVGVDAGKINATHSRTKTGKMHASRTYSSADWDAAALQMRSDIASSWMRNPVLQESENVQS